MAIQLVVLAAMVRTSCQQAESGSAAASGSSETVQRATIASAAFATTMQCRVSLQNMLNNEDWMFMNASMMSWCRIRLENRMSTCCTNAEFAKGMADSCKKDCIADCAFSKMEGLCNAHFGKACKLTRNPFSRNNVTMAVTETFCVPADCNNPEDLKDNLLIKWFDAQYRLERQTLWMYDYGDTKPLECPTMMVTIIISVVVAIILVILAIPVSIILFKAPKERGRVLQSAGDDDDHEDTPIESMDALQDASGTMGSGFGGTK